MTLSNAAGFGVALADYGAAIQSLRVPTAAGPVGVVLGYPDPAQYRSNPYYLGATIGRYAGRIGGGTFQHDGRCIELVTQADQHGNCLHGGPDGLHARRWSLIDSDRTSATFACHSADGDQGFPGALDITVHYALRADRLLIKLSAAAVADTVINLTNHAYFNLNGQGTVEGHEFTVNADRYTPLDAHDVPTGELRSVQGTVYDLRRAARLSDRLPELPTGYDQNFALNPPDWHAIDADGHRAGLAASAFSASSGIRLNVYTTQPGLQFYTGCHLGSPFAPLQGFCFEAQGFPDAPNQPSFPSTLLKAGARYEQLIVYEFEADR